MGSEPGTIVIVEDDENIADLVGLYLGREGYRVVKARDGESGLAAIETERPRLVVLDIGLPGAIDGLEVCRRLRKSTSVPVMMLTARDDEIDRVLGFEMGADDYVVKPFSPRELTVRIRAILRRGTELHLGEAEILRIGDIEVDNGRREVRLLGKVVPMTAREYDLLAYLAQNRGLALSRRQLLDGVWGTGWYGDERTVDVHIGQLRKKLGAALQLGTVWGIGYRLD